MIAYLEMKLQCESELSYQMSSLFQGVLMELLPQEFCEELHQSKLHPYAQHLEMRDKCWYWVVNCLNREATQIMILDTLMKQSELFIRKHELKITIIEKSYQEITYENLTKKFYEEEDERYVQLHFITPTAFKRQGKYLFYPDIRCIYQSLMSKYDAVMQEESMVDEDTLEELCNKSEVARYDLKSVVFHLEGIKIPSYIGKITLKISGTQTMVNFANMLFYFGVYSGVGIKTAIGMGAYKLVENNGGKRYGREAD